MDLSVPLYGWASRPDFVDSRLGVVFVGARLAGVFPAARVPLAGNGVDIGRCCCFLFLHSERSA